MHQGPAIDSGNLSRRTGHFGAECLESPLGTACRAREGSQAREPRKAPDCRGTGTGEIRMLIQVLGHVEVRSAQGQPIHLRPREKAVLGTLLLRAGTPCSAETLLQDVWGDDQPADPGGTLRLVVSRIRQAVAPESLITRAAGGAYRAEPACGTLDKHRFEGFLADASRAAGQRQAELEARLLEQAMAIWPHPEVGFPDVPHDSMRVRETTERLLEQRRTAEIRLADLHLALGRHEAALPALRAGYAIDPGSERRCAQLMLALIRSGRRQEALDAFQQCAHVLASEYGAHPGDELQALLKTALGLQ
jgi:DNA-binding SARP family transcriptional activator